MLCAQYGCSLVGYDITTTIVSNVIEPVSKMFSRRFFLDMEKVKAQKHMPDQPLVR